MEAVLEGIEPVESQGEEQPEQQQQPDPKQADREYTAWMKTLREDGDNGKHYRRVKDDFGRLQAITRLDPKGFDGIRERYSAIDGLAYSDKKGLDAVTSMQTALSESQTALDAIAQGDLTSLSDDQRAGIFRMAPAMLDALAESDAEGYTKAVLPHFVDALKGSDLARAYNGMLDVLKQQPPAWLKPEQKADWTNERLQNVLAHVTTIGQWFKAQDDRVKELGGADGQPKPRMDGQPEAKSGESGPSNPQFWETSVYPDTNTHAEQTFDKELRPWADKLAKAGFKLLPDKKTALAAEFVKGIEVEALKNKDYMGQMGRYNRQRSPDKASVVSTFKSEFNKHAPNILKALIERDYGQILDKRTAPKPGGNGATKNTPVVPQNGVKVVSVKPQRSDIDFPKTPADWLYQNKWRMKDGSVLQYQP